MGCFSGVAVETEATLTQVGFVAASNVFGEVLRAWQAVALQYTGQSTTGKIVWQSIRPSIDKTENRWLWDYYEVYLWLAELAFTTSDAEADRLRKQVNDFALLAGNAVFQCFLKRE